jgi:hypothetical protein
MGLGGGTCTSRTASNATAMVRKLLGSGRVRTQEVGGTNSAPPVSIQDRK